MLKSHSIPQRKWCQNDLPTFYPNLTLLSLHLQGAQPFFLGTYAAFSHRKLVPNFNQQIIINSFLHQSWFKECLCWCWILNYNKFNLQEAKFMFSKPVGGFEYDWQLTARYFSFPFYPYPNRFGSLEHRIHPKTH